MLVLGVVVRYGQVVVVVQREAIRNAYLTGIITSVLHYSLSIHQQWQLSRLTGHRYTFTHA